MSITCGGKTFSCTRKFCAAVGLSLALSVSFFSPAKARTAAYVLMDYNTGAVLQSSNPGLRLNPASLTKLMTLYLAFESIREGRFSLGQRIQISKRAVATPPTKLGMRAGRFVKFEHLIAATAVKSANDAAVAIAEVIAGSEWAFAELMTQKAAELGMTQTTFKNATGFTSKGHLSTARDMALLGRRLFHDFPAHNALFKRRNIRWGGRKIRATNIRFLSNYLGADGIKTGYTKAAGYTIVSSASRKQRRLIVSYFGASSTSKRTAAVTELMDQGWKILAQSSLRLAGFSPPTPAPRVDSPVAAGRAFQPGTWSVQVGAFHKPEQARALLDALRKKQPVFLVSAGANVKKQNGLYLARFQGLDRLAAYAACAKLKEARADCYVLQILAAPAVVATALVVPAAESLDVKWFVQVGAYRKEKHAQDRLAAVASSQSNTLAAASPSVVRRHKLYLARFDTQGKAAAKSICDQLKRTEIDCFVVQSKVVSPSASSPAKTVSTTQINAERAWIVQVGAYRKQSQARALLEALSKKKSAILGPADPGITQRGNLFLAHFRGVDKAGAQTACARLKGEKVDCFVYSVPILTDAPVAAPSVAALVQPAVYRVDEKVWTVQLGAFRKENQAWAQFESIYRKHSKTLGSTTPWVVLQNNLYLSRLRYASQAESAAICAKLKKAKVDCFVIAATSTSAPVIDAKADDKGWALQVGAFRQEIRAWSMLNSLLKRWSAILDQGVPWVQPRSGLFLSRFRYTEKAVAEQACSRLKASKVDCLVVSLLKTPLAITSVAQKEVTTQKADNWAVQVGAYSSSIRARNRLDKLRSLYAGHFEGRKLQVPKSGKYYLARFTKFEESGAKAACSQLKAQNIDCLVVLTGSGPSASTTEAAVVNRDWEIQVGAFRKKLDAQTELQRVEKKAASELGGHKSRIEVQGNIFVVRFIGFGKAESRQTCKELRLQKIECLPIRPKSLGNNVTASRSSWSIQVGAFGKSSQALAQLSAIADRKLGELADARQWVPKRGSLYLSRFGNLDKESASQACKNLQEQGVECLALAPVRRR